MSQTPSGVRIGSRGSALARWQTEHVRDLLQAAWPGLTVEIKIITTRGDRVLDTPLPQVGGKGLFTAELEAELRSGTIDLAVHSLKDLPTELPDGLDIGAIPLRADARDVWISRGGHTPENLPAGAAVGSSSTRRSAQLRHRRPDVQMIDIRGNVDTRIRKAQSADGPYDAIILAKAGVERLGFLDAVTLVLTLELMLPAPGQGALAIQCRDQQRFRDLLQPLNHLPTRNAVEAERAFLAGLGGGCAVPVAAYAEVDSGGSLTMRGRVCAVDGSNMVDVSGSLNRNQLSPESAARLGAELAERALSQGAADILLTGQSQEK